MIFVQVAIVTLKTPKQLIYISETSTPRLASIKCVLEKCKLKLFYNIICLP